MGSYNDIKHALSHYPALKDPPNIMERLNFLIKLACILGQSLYEDLSLPHRLVMLDL